MITVYFYHPRVRVHSTLHREFCFFCVSGKPLTCWPELPPSRSEQPTRLTLGHPVLAFHFVHMFFPSQMTSGKEAQTQQFGLALSRSHTHSYKRLKPKQLANTHSSNNSKKYIFFTLLFEWKQKQKEESVTCALMTRLHWSNLFARFFSNIIFAKIKIKIGTEIDANLHLILTVKILTTLQPFTVLWWGKSTGDFKN